MLLLSLFIEREGGDRGSFEVFLEFHIKDKDPQEYPKGGLCKPHPFLIDEIDKQPNPSNPFLALLAMPEAANPAIAKRGCKSPLPVLHKIVQHPELPLSVPADHPIARLARCDIRDLAELSRVG